MDIDRFIEKENRKLKDGKARARLCRKGGKIVIRATLPPKPGSSHVLPTQYDLSLGISATVDGVKTAVTHCWEITVALDRDRFDWSLYTKDKKSNGNSIGEWLERFKEWYVNEKYDGHLEPERAYRWAYEHHFKLLNPKEELTENALRKALDDAYPVTKNGVEKAASRNVAIIAFSSLARFAGITVDLRDKKFRYQPKEIYIPSDDEIIAAYELMGEKWKWIYGVMAVYGLRNHEAFRLDTSRSDEEPYIVRVVGGKTADRNVYPRSAEWRSLFNLDKKMLPNLNLGCSNVVLGQAISKRFKVDKVPFRPYALRHGYAVHLAIQGTDPSIAAKWMGHSVEVHQSTYHNWITEFHHNAAWMRSIKGS